MNQDNMPPSDTSTPIVTFPERSNLAVINMFMSLKEDINKYLSEGNQNTVK